MTESFPTAFAGPTSKERKYDRQLRLWAASGQQALERSKILLINSDGPLDDGNPAVSGVVGVETLKNLVLPGIGGFTIVDPAIITESDLGVNFFLDESGLGKPRAQETCKHLLELNPDVKGDFLNEPIEELLNGENFLQPYAIIIITGPMRHSLLKIVSSAAKQLSIPLIYTHSVGFYSAFSLQLPSVYPIVETHPDPNSVEDLRLINPFPELVAATAKIADLDSLDDHEHGHVPYLLLLLHFLEKWKATHDGNPPLSFKEKSAFREMIRNGARTNNATGGEENFDEAVAAVLKSVNPCSLKSNVRELFEMEECNNLDSTSENFWVIASAIKSFYTTHGVPPLPGSLPDMKAQSADYIFLQNIYKSKARKDFAEVVVGVRALETQLRVQSPQPPISEKEIETFCKHASSVKVIRGSDIPILDLHTDPATLKTIRNSLEIPDSLIHIFLTFQILDTLVTDYRESAAETQVEPPPSSFPFFLDQPDYWSAAQDKLLALVQTDGRSLDDDAKLRLANAVQETQRAGVGELHNIASLTGGMVAQEALKVLTRQYVPLDNTCIFDGIRSRAEMFRL
ncbi:amyloid beta protein binding protein [Histoplasma capsulatum var. duboisii H88]|uniref:NEDD8-activating enzyme E1 regulatory subunit n=1 Tax=Ajellomyces capsulatus (strain H88) TaxID=544711 RepID=F0UVT4_AJEC8|nr:amyloid beta protein binding protein [Histoplasma capsulatum var. duboisii H88]QSS50788.1 app binding protein [Histoplasma capsulatum var. duboisii H88]